MMSAGVLVFEILPLFPFFTAMVLLAVAKITNLKPFYFISVGCIGEFSFYSFIFQCLNTGIYGESFTIYNLYDAMGVVFIGALLIMAIILLSKVSYAKAEQEGEVIK